MRYDEQTQLGYLCVKYTDSQNGIFFLGNGQNLENIKAISALIPKIEKILISVVKILWGGGGGK